MEKYEDYFIGLDCGTSSVGWAVTDENYNLLRAKGKTLWGARLFDEAKTAAERRSARSSRRRIRRSADRIKLLNFLFDDEMAKIDPEFYLRLKKSFLLEEDKYLKNNSKNTLFNDENYKDKDFHKEYPTVWHLRQTILHASENQHFNLRLYYLAIHHILRNRGHFLREGKMEGAGNFKPIFDEFYEICEVFDIGVADGMEEKLSSLISNQKLSKRDKAKQIEEILFRESDEKDHRYTELAKLLAGLKVRPILIFEPDLNKDEVKETSELCFADSKLEEKLPEIESSLDSEQFSLIEAAKKIYDFGYLSELLDGENYIADAMVKKYDLHQEQLKKLKHILKSHKEDYNIFFRTEKITNDKTVCYNAYIGNAYTEDKNLRRKSFRIDQETINKEIVRLLEKHAPESDLLALAKEGQLLPKQKGQAKGTIPQQLHHNELKIILNHLAKDYPSFKSKTDKISSIHSFRIPYYCGPINTKNDRHWSDDEVAELVRPWNFDKLINKSERANKFIKSMTNKCTYLQTEDVLPKYSFLYQKYIVLNELNNLKINGVRIDQETKQKIFERAFENNEINGNITIKQLEKWLRNNGIITTNEELSGSAESKFLPKLSTHQDFKKIFGNDYQEKFKATNLEEAVNLITILNNEPKMLASKLCETLGEHCSEEQAKKLAKKSYKGWGRFSEKFLTCIKIEHNGTQSSLLKILEDNTENLMELLSSKYSFKNEIEKFNQLQNPPKTEITYDDINNLYCSPSVKRSIWQAIKIVDELVKVKGDAPKKIFLESTRDGNDPQKKGETLSRKNKLIELYSKIKSDPEAQKLLKQLEKVDPPQKLQSKKLYLYYTQMGRCAYCGERINLDDLLNGSTEYDIDHIYPRSKTKDDSITRNLVLVHRGHNKDKGDVFPIPADWQNKMRPYWQAWRRAELITQEKFERLNRTTQLNTKELSDFIARQIVETAQSVKALRGLLQQKYPKTEIILVKAKQVSDFRNHFANGYQNKKNGNSIPPRPEFIKLRALNDFHHAKDAYLNIVVGNVMNGTFTNDPYRWLCKNQESLNYSINPHVLWSETRPENGGFLKNWGYADSIKTISKNLARNNVLWTRMPHNQSGPISDLMPVGKSKKGDELLRLKKHLDPKKYGGYHSVKGSHFTLIEQKDEKGNTVRRIAQVPIHSKDRIAEYLNNTKEYQKSTIIIPEIPFNSLFKLNGNLMTISGKGLFAPAIQTFLPIQFFPHLQKVCKVNIDIMRSKGKYPIDYEKHGINAKKVIELYDALVEKLQIFDKMPSLGDRAKQLKAHRQDFINLSLDKQCATIEKILQVFGCNATRANLSDFLPKASDIGRCISSDNISKYNSAFLIHQSPTGLFEREINLKTCPPQTLNKKKV